MKQLHKIAISCVLCLVAGGAAATFLLPEYKKNNDEKKTEKIEEFGLINPTVAVDLGKHYIINFGPLKKELENIRKKYYQNNYVYFLYLNNGSWVGFNEKDEFTAASTVKVPVAMSMFKSIENGKLKLKDTYTLSELDLDDNFGELYKVGPDKEFTIEELVKIMLEQSDNTALKAVLNIFKSIGITDPFTDVYQSLGWELISTIPVVGQNTQPNYSKINLKTLSNMFLALYNATYVNVENSEKILEFLKNTPYNEKIVSGIPSGITVSHKIGISAGDETFSDCGIVYAPNRHYILCLGSNGSDENLANKFMAEISKAVYQFVIGN